MKQTELELVKEITGMNEEEIKKDFAIYCELAGLENSRESWLIYIDETESFGG